MMFQVLSIRISLIQQVLVFLGVCNFDDLLNDYYSLNDNSAEVKRDDIKTKKIKELKQHENLTINIMFWPDHVRKILIHNGDGYIDELFVNSNQRFIKINQ